MLRLIAIFLCCLKATAVWAADDAPTQPASATSIADVIRLVEERGWRANLDPICAVFDLPRSGGECIFKQISMRETEGRGDQRGFNVPIGPQRGDPYVLVFHLGPLIDEFFVISPNGALLKAFYSAKGTGYSPPPTADIREEFKVDLRYWLDNFGRLRSSVPPQSSPLPK